MSFTPRMAIDALVRLDILKKVMTARGMVKPSGDPSPGALGKAIKRETNYCSDLLRGRRSFGEDIARHIEESLGLPRWHLDAGESWPFYLVSQERWQQCGPDDQIYVQGAINQALNECEARREKSHLAVEHRSGLHLAAERPKEIAPATLSPHATPDLDQALKRSESKRRGQNAHRHKSEPVEGEKHDIGTKTTSGKGRTRGG